MHPGPIQRLISELAKLPGIGQRTAQRLAFHILRADEADALGLAEAIREVKEKVGLCEVCFNLAEGPRCRICEDERRDRSLICVVEEPSDVIPVERTGEYRGLYHVLGGALSPIDGVDPEDLRIAELVQRVDDGDVSEVVLATNPTTEGKRTPIVPLFVLGFLACVALRSTGLLPEQALSWITQIQVAALGAALFGMGCSVKIASLAKGSGAVLLTSTIGTLIITGTTLAGILLVSGL